MKANRRSGSCMAAGVVLVASLWSATAAGARAPRVTAIPYTPGAFVWHVTPPPALAERRLSNGCVRVPGSGLLGSGVYAQTATHVTTNWSWSNSSSNQPFHWYVFTAGGTIVDNARSEGPGSQQSEPSASYYWKVQNLGGSGQAWTVCF